MARNETSERPSAILAYDIITIVRLTTISQSWFWRRQKIVGHLNGSRSSCSHYRQHKISKTQMNMLQMYHRRTANISRMWLVRQSHTYASYRSVWVVSACTRIYPTYQAQHEPQRIRVVVPRVWTLSTNRKRIHMVCHATESVLSRRIHVCSI